MLVKMADEQKSTVVDEPTIVFSSASPEASNVTKKKSLRTKHVFCGVISLLIVALVVTGALVGMRIFTDHNMEVLKYTLKVKGVEQNVSTEENSVIYHVVKQDVEAWIVQDFDREIQVTKVVSDNKVMCYVTPLNRSAAVDPVSIPSTAPENTGDPKSSRNQIVFKVAQHSIKDISFLGKKASTMCHNIPTYHTIPDCGAGQNKSVVEMDTNTTSSVDHRSKRVPEFCATCNRPWCLCACGCCSIVCARFASASYTCYYANYNWYCLYWVYEVYYTFDLSYYNCWYYGRYYWP